jgi:hypothetical protein
MTEANFAARRCIRSLLACSIGLAIAGSADATPSVGAPALSADERAALLAGERIERPLRFSTDRGRYVGGLAYQIVGALPHEVLSALSSPERLPELLPRTQSARELESTATSTRVFLTQGAGPFVASYGVELVRVPDSNELRFWIDSREPRDIRDLWGFFRAEPHPDGRSIVTVAVVVDLGDGLVRALFEDRVQTMMLRSVSRIRDAVEPRRLVAGPNGEM